MHTLILGPSGSGKTYVAHALQQAGINAFDADEVVGISAWYNHNGEKVQAPTTAAEALENQYTFLWSRKVLQDFFKATYRSLFLWRLRQCFRSAVFV